MWKDSGRREESTGETKKRDGKSISKRYAASNRSAVKLYIKPFLEDHHLQKMSISKVTPAVMENLKKQLTEDTDLSNRRINAVLQAMRVPLGEAERLGMIRDNPSKKVGKLPEKKKEREILTPAEVKKFFSVEHEDIRLLGINLLAATTGMRLGECRGLLKQNLHEDWIDVKTNWVSEEGLKEPKWGSARAVPIPGRTYDLLSEIVEINPWGNDFIFYGVRKDLPLSEKLIQEHYIATLEKIEIDEDARKSRNLSFHAWRHFYNSMLRGKVEDHALRKLTGHHNEKMTDNYSAITEEHRTAVKALAKKMF